MAYKDTIFTLWASSPMTYPDSMAGASLAGPFCNMTPTDSKFGFWNVLCMYMTYPKVTGIAHDCHFSTEAGGSCKLVGRGSLHKDPSAHLCKQPDTRSLLALAYPIHIPMHVVCVLDEALAKSDLKTLSPKCNCFIDHGYLLLLQYLRLHLYSMYMDYPIYISF